MIYEVSCSVTEIHLIIACLFISCIVQCTVNVSSCYASNTVRNIKANSFTSYLLGHLFTEMGLLTPHTISISCLLEYVKS